jgi:GMP synthase (glutamine-hydrolysing)
VTLTTTLVLQHAAPEGPGILGERLDARGLIWRTVRCDLGEPVPEQHDGPLIVMGGPMGVYEADRHPHLADELRLLARAAAEDRPILGICLGSQLLATALGAAVSKSGIHEIGWHAVTRLDYPDPLFEQLPRAFSPLSWHGDVFTLPAGAVALARSALTPVQAFRHGKTRYGLLFHLEATGRLLEDMALAFPDDLVHGGLMLEEAPERLLALRPLAEAVFDAWIDLWSLAPARSA